MPYECYTNCLSNGDYRKVPEFNQPDLKDAIIKGYYGDSGYSSISTVKTSAVTNKTCTNLQGQRITSPRKGIYIQGGKKYIMK